MFRRVEYAAVKKKSAKFLMYMRMDLEPCREYSQSNWPLINVSFGLYDGRYFNENHWEILSKKGCINLS